MSTKMHNYRLSKERWWPFAKACREHYLTEHPIMKSLRVHSEKFVNWKQMSETIDALVEVGWAADLQLFDEGDTYLIRVLEPGYYFANNYTKWSLYGVEQVNYDNRADVPPEDEKNKAVAEWCDHKIAAKEYLVFTLLEKDDLLSACIESIMAQKSGPA